MTAPGVDQDPAGLGHLSTPVRRELRRQLAEDEAAERAEANRAKARDDRGCVDCGATLSWLRPGLGGWHPGPRCHLCWLDRGGDAGAGTDDRDARARACDAVLGDIGPPPWATAVPGPPTVAARWLPEYKAQAFRWFSEVSARPAPGGERFAYTSAEELRSRLYHGREPPPPKLYSRGRRHRCPSCGGKGECWQVEQVGLSAAVTSTGELSRVSRAHFRVTWTCSRCRYVEVEQRAEQVAGVPVSGLVG